MTLYPWLSISSVLGPFLGFPVDNVRKSFTEVNEIFEWKGNETKGLTWVPRYSMILVGTK